MEVAGLAVGVVGVAGLLGQIFDGVIKAYRIFTTASNLGRDSERLVCKIRIEEMRFVCWGKECGLAEGKFESSLVKFGQHDGLHQLAEMILKELYQTIMDLNKLQNRYGLKEEAPGSVDKETYKKISDPTNPFKPSMKLKARWVISDKEKFGLFLDDLHTASQPGYPSLSAYAQLKQLRINLDAREPNNKVLSSSVLKIPVWRLQCETEAGTPEKSITTASSIRTRATYQRPTSTMQNDSVSEQVSVLIEWTEFDPDECHTLEDRLQLLNRVDALARMLNSSHKRHPDLHTLDCIGYAEDAANSRYGMIYATPSFTNGASLSSLSTALDSPAAHTLADLLTRETPDLDWLGCVVMMAFLRLQACSSAEPSTIEMVFIFTACPEERSWRPSCSSVRRAGRTSKVAKVQSDSGVLLDGIVRKKSGCRRSGPALRWDFIAVCLLIKDIVSILRGSAAREHRELLLELHGLERALQEVEHLQSPPGQEISIDAVRVAALSCRFVLDQFSVKLKKYAALSDGNTTSRLQKWYKGAKWKIEMTQDVENLRAYLAIHTASLNLRLSTHSVANSTLAAQQARDHTRLLHDGLETAINETRLIQHSLDEHKTVLESSTAAISNLLATISQDTGDRLNDVASKAEKIWDANQRMIQLLSTAQQLPTRPDLRHTWFQAPHKFEDALGGILPIPAEFGWSLLEAVIKGRFKTGPGKEKVTAGEYELSLSRDSSVLLDRENFEYLQPGSGISMALVIGVYELRQQLRCLKPSCLGMEFVRVEFGGLVCQKCGIWFDHAHSPLPKPYRSLQLLLDTIEKTRAGVVSSFPSEVILPKPKLFRETREERKWFKRVRIFHSDWYEVQIFFDKALAAKSMVLKTLPQEQAVLLDPPVCTSSMNVYDSLASEKKNSLWARMWDILCDVTGLDIPNDDAKDDLRWEEFGIDSLLELELSHLWYLELGRSVRYDIMVMWTREFATVGELRRHEADSFVCTGVEEQNYGSTRPNYFKIEFLQRDYNLQLPWPCCLTVEPALVQFLAVQLLELAQDSSYHYARFLVIEGLPFDLFCRRRRILLHLGEATIGKSWQRCDARWDFKSTTALDGLRSDSGESDPSSAECARVKIRQILLHGIGTSCHIFKEPIGLQLEFISQSGGPEACGIILKNLRQGHNEAVGALCIVGARRVWERWWGANGLELAEPGPTIRVFQRSLKSVGVCDAMFEDERLCQFGNVGDAGRRGEQKDVSAQELKLCNGPRVRCLLVGFGLDLAQLKGSHEAIAALLPEANLGRRGGLGACGCQARKGNVGALVGEGEGSVVGDAGGSIETVDAMVDDSTGDGADQSPLIKVHRIIARVFDEQQDGLDAGDGAGPQDDLCQLEGWGDVGDGELVVGVLITLRLRDESDGEDHAHDPSVHLGGSDGGRVALIEGAPEGALFEDRQEGEDAGQVVLGNLDGLVAWRQWAGQVAGDGLLAGGGHDEPCVRHGLREAVEVAGGGVDGQHAKVGHETLDILGLLLLDDAGVVGCGRRRGCTVTQIARARTDARSMHEVLAAGLRQTLLQFVDAGLESRNIAALAAACKLRLGATGAVGAFAGTLTRLDATGKLAIAACLGLLAARACSNRPADDQRRGFKHLQKSGAASSARRQSGVIPPPQAPSGRGGPRGRVEWLRTRVWECERMERLSSDDKSRAVPTAQSTSRRPGCRTRAYITHTDTTRQMGVARSPGDQTRTDADGLNWRLPSPLPGPGGRPHTLREPHGAPRDASLLPASGPARRHSTSARKKMSLQTARALPANGCRASDGCESAQLLLLSRRYTRLQRPAHADAMPPPISGGSVDRRANAGTAKRGSGFGQRVEQASLLPGHGCAQPLPLGAAPLAGGAAVHELVQRGIAKSFSRTAHSANKKLDWLRRQDARYAGRPALPLCGPAMLPQLHRNLPQTGGLVVHHHHRFACACLLSLSSCSVASAWSFVVVVVAVVLPASLPPLLSPPPLPHLPTTLCARDVLDRRVRGAPLHQSMASTPDLRLSDRRTCNEPESRPSLDDGLSRSSRVAHTLTACARCRKRKSRCDPGLPRCHQCERTGSVCEYFDASKGRMMPRTYIIQLQEEVKRLERELAEVETDSREEPDPEALVREAAIVRLHDTDERKYLGPSSGTTMTRILIQLAKRITGADSISDIISAEKARRAQDRRYAEESKPSSKDVDYTYPLTSQGANPVLPSQEITTLLMEVYNIKVQTMYPIIHEPTLADVIRSVYSGSTDPYENFTARMVIAIALQRGHNRLAGLGDSYYLAAMQHFEAVVRPMDLKTLQCFVLIGEYSLLTPTRTAAFYVVGLAVRLAQALGITEECTLNYNSDGSPASLFDIDMRRRIFWAVVTMDYGLAHSLGRPAMMSTAQDYIDVQYFEPIDDASILPDGFLLGSFSTRKWIAIHFYKMRMLQLEIRRTLYQRKRDTPTSDKDPWFQQIKSKMDQWRDASPNNDQDSGFNKTWFQGRYNTIVVFLYRPSPQVPRPSGDAAVMCYEACEFNIHMQREQIQTRSVELTWIFTQSLFMAVNTILWSLSYKEVRQLHSREKVKDHLDLALEAIKLASERWPGVSSALELYELLIDACLTIYEKETGDVPISAASPFDSDLSSPSASGVENELWQRSSRTTSPAAFSLGSISDIDGVNSTTGQYLDSGQTESSTGANRSHANSFTSDAGGFGSLSPEFRQSVTFEGSPGSTAISDRHLSVGPADRPFNTLPTTFAEMNNWDFTSALNTHAINDLDYFPLIGPIMQSADATSDAAGGAPPEFHSGQSDGLTFAQQAELLRGLENDGIAEFEEMISSGKAMFAPKPDAQG
ncbi:hypothetical protein FH972_022134 [Carpinus fangiana]|uniref:Zn(2)-C6 fungal-type domain-containing protein n=1 Tax=Carpinus fangiana TaxID=176857 RepID=A0A5N6KRP8_9ROSI|nr:hypothetical protein FH972_022134 [Carpinus fangiana]